MLNLFIIMYVGQKYPKVNLYMILNYLFILLLIYKY